MNTANEAHLRPVYVTSALFCLLAAVYGATGVRPSPLISFGLSFGPLLAGAAWLERDARGRRMPLAYDWGFFLAAFWPIFISWYAIATRRRRGFGLIVRLAMSLVMPNVTLNVVGAITGH